MGKHLAPKENKEKNIRLPKLNIKKPSVPQEEAEHKKTISLPAFRPQKSNGIVSIAVPAIFIAVLPFLSLDFRIIKCMYAVALVVAVLDFVWVLLENIQLKEYFAVEHMILIASVLAFIIGLNTEAVLIPVLFSIFKIVLAKAEKSSWTKLKSFSDIVPETACVETVEGELKVQADYVNAGDIITVAAGEKIPLDGIIVEGISTIDTSAVSGHTTAWAVNEGHRVYSGCRNITSPIKVRAAKPFAQSTAKSLVDLAESSTEYSSRQEKFALAIKRYYPLAMLLAALALTVVLSILNGQWTENISRAVVLLVSSGSALALAAVSMAYIRSIGAASENGTFVKGSDCIEAMARAETMVFDKTGIITEGRYVITDVFPNKVTEQQLLSMAATAERFSRHPIATCLRDAAGPLDIDYRSLQIEELPGRGVSAFVGEKQVYVGNAALLEEHGITCPVPTRSGAAIHVAVDYKYWGHIIISDRIRRGAFDSLENLRALGVKKLVLLTGDVLSVAKPLASKLNFDMLRAELKPSEKASAVEFLMANRGESTTLAFVGDGSSNEQIMSRVDVGIAIGALGSDAALASADVLIMDRDIKKLPSAIKLSRLTYNSALISIIAWIAVNTLVVVLGAIGVLPVIIALVLEFIMACALIVNSSRVK